MLTHDRRAYMQALKIMTHATVLIRRRERTGHNSARGLKADAELCALVRPGYYEHFKSSKDEPKFYRVFEVLSHVNYTAEADAYQVRYAAEYPPHKGRKTLRELLGPDGFLTPILRGNYVGPRFRYVGGKLPKRAKKRAERKTKR